LIFSPEDKREMEVFIFRPVEVRFRVAFNALELVIIAIGEDIIFSSLIIVLLSMKSAWTLSNRSSCCSLSTT